MAIWVDDVPINMRTHAHGQGYADLNWLMPETVNTLDIRKGPYFADEGDFGSAGNLHIGLIDSVDKAIAEVTAGSFGYRRIFGMGSGQAWATERCWPPAKSAPTTGRGPIRTTCKNLTGCCGTPRERRWTVSPSPAWPIRTAGIRPIRCPNARSHPDKSDSTARKIRPTAATPTALRCRGGSREPTTPVPGRPMRLWSKASSISTTTSLISSSTRRLAISFTSTTIASWPAAMHRAP